MGVIAQTKLRPSGRVYTCKVNDVCEDAEDRAAVAAWMADQTNSNEAIADKLGVSKGTVRNHRAGRCVCFRNG